MTHWSEVDHGDAEPREVIDQELQKRGLPLTDKNRTMLVTEVLEHMESQGLVIRHNGRTWPVKHKH